MPEYDQEQAAAEQTVAKFQQIAEAMAADFREAATAHAGAPAEAPAGPRNMETLYQELAALTSEAADLKAARDIAHEAMMTSEAGGAYQGAEIDFGMAEAKRKEARSILNTAAVIVYEDTGIKTPHPRVTIRVRTAPVYDKSEAFGWAISRQPDFIIPSHIDTRLFEKYARAVREVAPLDFVQWDESPTVAVTLR